MKRNVPETAVAILVLLVTGCSAPQSGADLSSDPGVEAPTVEGHETPELALTAFVSAWNSEDFGAVARTFHPERRELVASQRPKVEARFSRWRIEDSEVDTICHPRGGGWKTSRFVRVDPTSDERVEDVAWMRLGDGKWWMYSL